MRTIYPLKGGIHPPQHKDESNGTPIAPAPLPARLTVALRQHMGAPAKAVVQVGDKVLKGQLIGAPDGFLSAAVHAPTSGTVAAIESLPVPHPSGMADTCIVIDSDGEDRWIERKPLDYKNTPAKEVVDYIRQSGIVGLGGAGFPSHIKYGPPPGSAVETLILNGAECEPWITSDDLLMRERAADVVAGIQILRHLLNPKETLVGIEDNKPEAIRAMETACQGTGIEVVATPTVYPTGGEKQLIKILTNKEVPSGGLPLHIGVVCANVATAYSVHRAVNLGEPLVSRIVTITGNVKTPRNFEVLIGTPMSELMRAAGGALPDTDRYIMGGPMMGLEFDAQDYPVVKSCNCFIACSQALFPSASPAMPCTRCTHCSQVCPVGLRPYELQWFIRGGNYEKARNYALFDCIECGCCSYVCASSIPLVQFFRFGKGELRSTDAEKRAQEISRQRSEAKQARLEKEKAEKAAKLAKAAAAKEKPADSPEAQAKQEAIQAAVERAKAAKEGVAPQNTDNLPPEVQQEISGIEARRAQASEKSEA